MRKYRVGQVDYIIKVFFGFNPPMIAFSAPFLPLYPVLLSLLAKYQICAGYYFDDRLWQIMFSTSARGNPRGGPFPGSPKGNGPRSLGRLLRCKPLHE